MTEIAGKNYKLVTMKPEGYKHNIYKYPCKGCAFYDSIAPDCLENEVLNACLEDGNMDKVWKLTSGTIHTEPPETE